MPDARAVRRSAFAGDAGLQALRSTFKAAFWTAGGFAARRASQQRDHDEAERFAPTTPPPDRLRLRRAWLEAFVKDAADVAAGLYPASEPMFSDPRRALDAVDDLVKDAREVADRRRRKGGVEARSEAGSEAYPLYYRQNFHFQSGGWFTPDSARRYEPQVEALFSGAAGAMRRRALSLLARAWRGRDQRGLTVVDLACGAGGFLTDLKTAFPRARVVGLDLSPSYAVEAAARSGAPVTQSAAERLPFADASLDAVSCIYLFHELPPKVRPVVAAEIARVLKPGGLLALADSVQPQDEPGLARLLEAFPAFFHEPYYAGWQTTDVEALFGEAGLRPAGTDKAFLTKAWLFEKPAA
ncbi:class I SAM-dependent methyltransferase [Caulobacter sp. 17J65-9]|uniref:class I SAM-dependent methyltransferase n=1 Tax=Caulobacter sp. 17J65-9 TaxID=2709382 RepID=UPI0013C60164|nr:class I SAM-dependent methyltransferase [Caulobacter sp. 17J65-9]NEX95074.1 class I SAM-dependent methyltransferase [Caulobacter sp. 17J65-9]